MHIRIIVPVVSSPDVALRSDKDLEPLQQPGLEITYAYLKTGPYSIESRKDETFAAPGIVAAAMEAEQDGCDAVIINCMGDPGLGAAREAVNIPVLGAAQTSMNIHNILGRKFGIVTVLQQVEPLFQELVDQYGFKDRYAGCRWVDIPVLELHKRMSETQDRLAGQALQLVQEGADGIVLGCTGFLGCAEVIRKRLADAGFDVPVIDPIPVTISCAVGLIRSKLSHSKVTYPSSAQKHYKGY